MVIFLHLEVLVEKDQRFNALRDTDVQSNVSLLPENIVTAITKKFSFPIIAGSNIAGHSAYQFLEGRILFHCY